MRIQQATWGSLRLSSTWCCSSFSLPVSGPPDHANRGDRAELLEQHLVHREFGEPDPLDQPDRQVAHLAGLCVASVPEDIYRAIGRKLPPDDSQRILRLKPE